MRVAVALAVLAARAGCELAADPSYDAVLGEFNACLGRSPAPVGYHVWSGSAGHREIGNLLVSVVHAFVDALMHNRRLVVGRAARAGWERHQDSDIGLQALLMSLLPVRLAWAPAECAGSCRGHVAKGDAARARAGAIAAAQCSNCTASGWEPHFDEIDDAHFSCLARATRCRADAADAGAGALAPAARAWRRPATCKHCGSRHFRCAAHAAFRALVDAPRVVGSPLAEAARRFAPLYSDAATFERVVAQPDARFAAAVHVRLILPGVDHARDRNVNACSLASARRWAAGACRDASWAEAAATLRRELGAGRLAAREPVLVLSESNVVTRDLIGYLRANASVNAQGFVYPEQAEVAREMLTMDWVEWWFLSRAARVFYAGQHDMTARPSSFSIRASDMADAPYEPLLPAKGGRAGCRGEGYSGPNATQYWMGMTRRCVEADGLEWRKFEA